MSLFGQSGPAGGTTNVGSSSLFGSLNLDTSVPSAADPTAKRKSIFEPSSTTEARSKTSMFGGLGGTSAAATQSTTGPSLFANLNAPSSQPASTGGGLFGSTTATAGVGAGGSGTGAGNATGGSTGFGLFGKPAATATNNPAGPAANTAPGASLFGASNIGFSNPPQPQAAQQQQQQQQSQQGDAQLHNRESAYFNGLLERQKKKIKFNNDQSTQLGQLPSMNMDLGDLARRAQELGQKSQKLGQSVGRDSRAHYLLSGAGVTPGQAYKEFQKLDADAPSVATQTRIDFAEEGSAYLRGMQARGREAMLKESMDRVYRDVDSFIEESLGIDFDEQKKRIMHHFGLLSKADLTDSNTASFATSSPAKPKSTRRSIFGRSGLDKSIIGNASSIGGSASFFGGQIASLPTNLNKNQSARDLRDKERLFIQQVEALNRKRLDQETYKVFQEFKAVESSVPGEVPKQLIDAYAALGEITKEGQDDNKLTPRHYADAHAIGASPAVALRLKKQILDGSRSFLEKNFYQELEEVNQKNPRAAQVGGLPTILNKVRGYIRVRGERHDLARDGAVLEKIGDNEDYCWIIIFYLLRSGHVQEAVEYVNSDPAFQSLDRRFVSYLTAYANSPDRRLGSHLQSMCNGDYQQRTKVQTKHPVDPYRVACLKIVGRCELSQRNLEDIGQGVEDWIWLQFALARESESLDASAGELYGLEQIVETVTEIGEKHFQKGKAENLNSYGTYFLMQILAGMFEQAVDYLHSFNPVSAVHAAIALDYYGLLRVSDFQVAGNELLTHTTQSQAQINFVPLIAYYTTTFRAALPVQAVDYLTLICLNSDLPKPLGETMTNACHESLRELCLETREFAALLGDIRNDGSRIPGAIEQRASLILLDSHEQFLRFITSQAAAVADSRGQTADAVLLYHLSDDYDNVTSVLNRALADAISVELGDEPMSLQPLKPRTSNSQSDPTTAAQSANSSLSLTQSSSTPLSLALKITALYDTSATYYSQITTPNRNTLQILIRMLLARAKIEHPTHPEYLRALEDLNSINILPLDTRGDIPMIREMATRFSALPHLVTRCAGLVILWCVRAIGAERERIALEGGGWSIASTSASSSSGGGAGQSEDDLSDLRNQLNQMARDLMVFAGLVRYKLPGRVYDMLTRVGDGGGY